jgi:hypothetical protein
MHYAWVMFSSIYLCGEYAMVIGAGWREYRKIEPIFCNLLTDSISSRVYTAPFRLV